MMFDELDQIYYLDASTKLGLHRRTLVQSDSAELYTVAEIF